MITHAAEAPGIVPMKVASNCSARAGGMSGVGADAPAARLDSVSVLRGSPRAALVALAVVFVVGAFLRFENVQEPNEARSNDERAYVSLAANLADRFHYGYGTSRETTDPAHWPPGAPLFFAGVMWVSGQIPNARDPDDPWDVPAVYHAQAAVASLTILAAFALAFVVAGAWAGVAAAAVTALYPPLIYHTSDLLSEPLGAFLLTSGLALTAWGIRRPAWWKLVAAGAVLGLTILTRADLALVPGIALAVAGAVAWHRAGRVAAGLRSAALVGGAALLVVLPWTIFASTTKDELVPLTSGGGSNFWMGTYLPGGGTLFGSKREWTEAVRANHPGYRDTYWEDIPQVYVLEAVARRHPELERDAALRREGWANLRRYAIGRPGSFAKMMAAKAWRMWGKPPTGSGRVAKAWITALHLAICAIALAGLLAGLALTRRAELWLIALSLAYVTLLNMILVSEARHLVTSIPSLAAGGAAGIALAIPILRARLQRRRSRDPVAAAGL